MDLLSLLQGWRMQYGPDPTLEECCEDDEQKLLLVFENEEKKNKTGDYSECDSMDPKVTDWRFGPAQIWYDILKIPETGENFNYGFKLADKNTDEFGNRLTIDGLDDDAFLMVSQLHWEDDVIWNGDDIKHKVGLSK